MHTTTELESGLRDEVWEGETVGSPIADFEHQTLANHLAAFLVWILGWDEQVVVTQGCNVSDRVEGWESNYRIPDVAVFLKGGRGTILGTHSVGGPDFLVEILSDADAAPRKLPFYAANGVGEALYVARTPWRLELFRNIEGDLVRVQVAEEDGAASIECEVVPLSLRLIPNAEGDRPGVELRHRGGDLVRVV